MTKTLEDYMSLRYPVKLEPREDGSYFATHPDLQGCMAQGATADEAVRNLRDSREVWIEARLKSGYGVPEPAAEDEYSGRLQLRMSPRLHAGLAEAAANENVSLNQLITGVLSEYLGGARLQDLFLVSLSRFQEGVTSEISRVLGTMETALNQQGGSHALNQHGASNINQARATSARQHQLAPSYQQRHAGLLNYTSEAQA